MNPGACSAVELGRGPFLATIKYAPPSIAAITRVTIKRPMFMVISFQDFAGWGETSNTGLPFRIIQTAGVDWKLPLPGALVSRSAVPS